jgi:uncharacterized membrane protein YkvA (DUF1232 family)
MQILGQIKQFLETVSYIWRDSRVPLLARIFVVLAPLYWINPFDLIPDLQPGGFYDDLTIFCLLVIMAFRLVPKTVFRDAREAALLGKKAAVFGVLYATLSGIIPCPVHTTQFSKNSAFRLQQQLALDCSMSPKQEQQLTQAQARDRFDHCKQFRFNGFSDNQYFASSHIPGDSQSAVAITYNLASGPYPLPIYLITRGGQRQVYASEDSEVAILPAKSLCPLNMPPSLGGGIFAALPASNDDAVEGIVLMKRFENVSEEV